MQPKYFVAFDLGATSGRTILGTLSNQTISIREISRFPNQVVHYKQHIYWNIFSLYEHICEGLRLVAQQYPQITSIGIDTWGVDVAFVGKDGELLGAPFAYRDPYNEGVPDTYFKNIIPRRDVYERTGIQIMDFNTLYQLYERKMSHSSQLEAADAILFIPDALSYMLTGAKITEYTILSTSQLLNPRTKAIDSELLEKIGIDAHKFPEIVMPGSLIGSLEPKLAELTQLGAVPVVAVAGHDTASAVAAIPTVDQHFAYLSSGTWSLMGIETPEPVINDRTFRYNFTNEGGVEGTTRLLKNITGMWLLEECLKQWKREGVSYTYPQIVEMAQKSTPFLAMIDPDDPLFAHPQSMPQAISLYCEQHGQQIPQSHAAYIRLIFESLALKYRFVLDRLRTFAPFPIHRLHVIGGGSKNALLNQFTANSTGISVIAGPSEATALGNIMMQVKAAGCVDSIASMRRMLLDSIPTDTYEPMDRHVWEEAYQRFTNLIKE